MSALQKSARIYRAMVASLPALTAESARSEAYRATVAYLRALHMEYGRGEVRRAIQEASA